MKKNVKRLAVYLALLFLLSSLTVIYLVQVTAVTGSSMAPTLEDGQRILINKFEYGLKDPKRFDIVVFRYLYKHNQYYVKRLIGLPGETVQIKDGAVFINGEALQVIDRAEMIQTAGRTSEPIQTAGRASEPIQAAGQASEPIQAAGRASEPVLLGKDEYFVLGDNRNFSSDSREADVGNVKREQILGKAVFRLWPPGLLH